VPEEFLKVDENTSLRLLLAPEGLAYLVEGLGRLRGLERVQLAYAPSTDQWAVSDAATGQTMLLASELKLDRLSAERMLRAYLTSTAPLLFHTPDRPQRHNNQDLWTLIE
jgi:hypothetical protein